MQGWLSGGRWSTGPAVVAVAMALSLASLLGGAAPGARAADPIAPAPHLFLADGPFTRNADVRLGFVTFVDGQPNGGPVARYVASNDPATGDDGLLVNGVDVPESGTWTPAAGPDGPRTIYGQVQYTSGLWSPVASTVVTVDLSPASSLAVDVDARSIYWAPDWTDWHTRTTTPGTRIVAGGDNVPDPTPDTVYVGDATWTVQLMTPGEPIAAGTHEIAPPVDGSCGGPCAVVTVAQGERCVATGGSFTIADLVLTPEGDVDVLDADFSLTCGADTARMSGSIRYGSARATKALDQDADALWYPITVLATPAAPQSVTLTNFGTTPVALGAASLVGDEAADFAVTGDGCSGTTLAVAGTCSVTVGFTPSGIGQRRAWLEVPDATPGGRRRLMVQGYGETHTTVSVAVTPPAFGPGDATVDMTTTPPDGPLPVGTLDGVAYVQGACTSSLPDPGHRVTTCTVPLSPGHHVLGASVAAEPYYLASTATEVPVDVGTSATLALGLTTDDGVAAGESATLRAALDTGGPIAGGTLTIRDGLTDAVLATDEVSGTDPVLTVAVTRPAGTHPFTAAFTPASPDVQDPPDAAFDLVVVAGTRPETVMSSTPLVTNGNASTTFSSPDAGVAFQCRAGGSLWWACSSPAVFSAGIPGTVAIEVRAVRANGLADRTPATRPWTLDQADPVPGSISINGGRAWTRSPSVTVSITPGSDNVAIRGMGLESQPNGSWLIGPQVTSRTWLLTRSNGIKTLYARWVDTAGNWSGVVSDSIGLDTVLPTASGPRPAFVSGAVVRDGLVPVRLGWKGTDATSGIARYSLQRSRDGGAWVTVSTTITSGAANLRLVAGHDYRFRVRAIDRAGNVGPWAGGPTFRLSAASEAAASIHYAGTWRSASVPGAWGGRVRSASARGDSARIRVTARSFAWVAATGPGRGTARVYVDGTLVATVDLAAASTSGGRVVFAKTWPTTITRTIVVRVAGTAGHPRVDLDGFAWAR